MTEPVLAGWLPQQRWYGGKGRALAAVRLVSEVVLDDDRVRLSMVEAADEDGTQYYQLLLGEWEGELPDRLAHAQVGEHEGRQLFDAAFDQAATGRLLELLATGALLGPLRFTATEELPTGLPSRVIGAEQSNTSIVYGDQLIFKLFRRIQPGLNPDLELSRAVGQAGNPHVARPLAWLEADVAGVPTTLGLAQPYLASASEGWAMATTSVRDLFAEGDLHADEVGGDFAAEASRLGQATGAVHRTLREVMPTARMDADRLGELVEQLLDRLTAAAAAVPALAPFEDAVRGRYAAIREVRSPVLVQRIHGDLHLGQVLRTREGWVLIDFEGEPARPLAERTALMSPLRDVAGMLRSFDYAAQHLLAERGHDPQLAYRAWEWAERNREAFCSGYAESTGADPRSERVLLRAFELDKAVYEVVYEARNRPHWLPIPLASIERLAGPTA